MVAEVALFLSAFLAATILPLSSEATFVLALHNDMPKLTALFFASSGNILAIILNYFLGYFLYRYSKEKLLRSKTGSHAFRLGHKYGYIALLLSWMPIIGDPITIVAGVVRLRFVWFVMIAGVLRVARYYFLTLVV